MSGGNWLGVSVQGVNSRGVGGLKPRTVSIYSVHIIASISVFMVRFLLSPSLPSLPSI